MALEAPELVLVSCPLTGSPVPLSSCWDTERMTSCFLSGSLGAPHAIGLVFPVASTTALWDPPVRSQRGILLPEGCLEHVPLWPPGVPWARVRLCYRSGCSVGVGCPAGRRWERHK